MVSPLGAKIFTVKASKLGRRWNTSFHKPAEFSLPCKAKPLGQLAQILRGISVPSRKYLDRSVKEGLLYIRISDIFDGQLTDKAAKYIPMKLWKLRLKAGDILLSVRGSIGKTALVPKTFEGAVPSSQLIVLRPYEHLIDRNYFFRILSSEVVQKQLERIKVGQFISHVSMAELRRLLIPLPPMQEQLRIVAKIEELDKRYRKTSREREKIKQEINRILKGEAS